MRFKAQALVLLFVVAATIPLVTACGGAARGPAEKEASVSEVRADEVKASKPITQKERKEVAAASKTFMPAKKGSAKVELIDIDRLSEFAIPETTAGTLRQGIREAQQKYQQVIVARISQGPDDSVYIVWRRNNGEQWKPSD